MHDFEAKEIGRLDMIKEVLISRMEAMSNNHCAKELNDWKLIFRRAWNHPEEGTIHADKALDILIDKIKETKPMNDLEKYIADKQLNETKTMNALQEYGVISDRAVWARDVHPDDWQMAILWLVENY